MKRFLKAIFPAQLSKDMAIDIPEDLPEHWDQLAEEMPDLYPAPSTQYYKRSEMALIERYIGPLDGKSVLKLDLWNEAFNTRILHWMKDQGADVYGLDISRVIISRATKNSVVFNNNLELVQADIRHVPFEDNSFDFVYTMGTIEHIEDYHIARKEIHRVLKHGGKAIIGVPYKWNLFLRPLIVKILDILGKYPYSPEKSFGYKEFKNAVEDQNLQVCNRSGILAIPGLIRLADLYLFSRKIPFYKLTPLIIGPFEFMEQRWDWTNRLGYLIALIVEKVPAEIKS